MQPMRLDEDIRPLSEFRSGVASYIKQWATPAVRSCSRSTAASRGRDRHPRVRAHARAARDLDDIEAARIEIAAGQGLSSDEARAAVRTTSRMRVVWSKRATARVVEIARYIASDSPQAAERWSDALISASTSRRLPGMGKLARDVATPGVHELVFATSASSTRSPRRSTS